MIDNITTEAHYNQVIALIENYIAKATHIGGFNFLSEKDKEELSSFSLLVEQYEDNVLKTMPLPVN